VRALLAALALALAAAPAGADPGRKAFVAWARDRAVAMPDCSSTLSSSDWMGVEAIVGKARLVALGEPAHGAHEPLALRNCLFRHLVEHHGFTAIALETGLSESRRLHDYVAGGPGDGPALVRASLTWGFGRYAENLELIEWMRRYNLDPAHPRKIGFYGIDLSGGDAEGTWRRARMTLDASLDYLSRAEPARSTSVRSALEPFLDRFTHAGHTAMTPVERTRLHAALARLVQYFDANRTALIAASNASDYAWNRRNAVLAGQIERYFLASRPPGRDGELAPEDYRADEARDAAMAANVRWVLDQEGASGRVLVFAHDGHIANAPTRGGIWSVYARPPMAMGQHLKAALGAAVAVIPILSPADDPRGASGGKAGDLDGALAQTGLDRFALDLRAAPRGWLDQPRSMRVNFDTEAVITPRRAFDAAIFLRTLSPAQRDRP
jgi:erythromycin esterase